VFVSPFIKAGTIIKTPFEHCSIVATVRKLFCLDKTPFNWREAQAATFDNVLNLPADQVRQDNVVLPNPVASPPLVGAAAAIVPPAVRKPTDLAVDIARAMQYSMDTLGLQPAMRVSQIYTAQDAIDFLKQAAALMKAKGRR
jgi:hypothetical protein